MKELLVAIDWDPLWRGLTGPFMSALVGALSALLVVYFTNRHSKREAEKERMIRAIADLVATSQSVYFIDRLEEVTGGLNSLESALIRLRMAHKDGAELFEAMRYLPAGLAKLQALHLRRELSQEHHERCRSALRRAGVQLRSHVPDWVEGPKERRQEILEILREESKNVQVVLDETSDALQ